MMIKYRTAMELLEFFARDEDVHFEKSYRDTILYVPASDVWKYRRILEKVSFRYTKSHAQFTYFFAGFKIKVKKVK